MIRATTKKEHRKIKSLRKLYSKADSFGLCFIGPDGKAYICDTPGMQGVKEMNLFIKKMKADLTAQTQLL
jgi:hypothetical protein